MAKTTITQIYSTTTRNMIFLSQCALASVRSSDDQTPTAIAINSVLTAWSEALPYLGKLLGEFPGSVASIASTRALGMLLRPQIAQDVAADEVYALLSQSDAIKEQLADGNWQPVAEVLTRACIGAYLAALVEAVR